MFLSSETSMSGSFLSSIKGIKYRFEFQEGTFDFSRDAAVGKGLILQRRRNLMVFLELRWDSRVMMGKQGASHGAPGKSNLHSSWEGELGVSLESLQGK